MDLEIKYREPWTPVSEQMPTMTATYELQTQLSTILQSWYRADERKFYVSGSDLTPFNSCWEIKAWRPKPDERRYQWHPIHEIDSYWVDNEIGPKNLVLMRREADGSTIIRTLEWARQMHRQYSHFCLLPKPEPLPRDLMPKQEHELTLGDVTVTVEAPTREAAIQSLKDSLEAL